MATGTKNERERGLTAPRVADGELVVLHGDGRNAQDDDRVLGCGRLGGTGRLRRWLLVLRMLGVRMAVRDGLVVVVAAIWHVVGVPIVNGKGVMGLGDMGCIHDPCCTSIARGVWDIRVCVARVA